MKDKLVYNYRHEQEFGGGLQNIDRPYCNFNNSTY